MNKKTIISIIVIIIGVTSLAWWSKSVENEESNVPEVTKSHPARTGNITTKTLTALETFYDFGTISMKNGNVSKVFKVSNPGDQDINMEKLTTSCMCTTAFVLREDGSKSRPFGMPGHGGAVPKANEIIKAGGSLGIDVVYDPNAHGPAGVGRINRFIYLEDANGNKLQFEIKANVTP